MISNGNGEQKIPSSAIEMTPGVSDKVESDFYKLD